MRSIKTILLLALAVMTLSALASADVIATFDVSGTYTNGDSYALHFTSSATPVPVSFDAGQDLELYVSGTETLNGVTTSFTNADSWFYSTSMGGGVSVGTPDGWWNFFALQLYAGPESAPTFIDVANWNIDLTQSNGPQGSFASAFGNSDPPPAVPEPSTLMLVGSAFGFVEPLRRRYLRR